ncbi:MAG: ATP-binding protein, partial [Pseudobdellovibrionaceae bacterium]
MDKSESLTFQIERKNTDKSLELERERTSRSIAQARNKVELQTNKSIREDRSDTDQNIANARETADTLRYDQTKDTKDEKRRTEEAWTLADAAVQLERSRIDDAMIRERQVMSSLEASLIYQERQQTDKSIAEERTITDNLVLSNSAKLSKEKVEHTKTKASLTTRDEFLAIVSHDLRNPIGAISSCMELLLEDSVDRKIDKETRNWLELAKRNADLSLRLISDVLDMERIAEGKLELTIAPGDIVKLIKEVMESFTYAAATKNVLLRSAPIAITGQLYFDQDRLAQVLSNLLGNALKYTPEGGKIVLYVDDSADEDLTISICDTGIGIPEEEKAQIFKKFAQLGSKDRNGLGLGLYISKMLVEAHGGKLWVESQLGIGSIRSEE